MYRWNFSIRTILIFTAYISICVAAIISKNILIGGLLWLFVHILVFSSLPVLFDAQDVKQSKFWKGFACTSLGLLAYTDFVGNGGHPRTVIREPTHFVVGKIMYRESISVQFEKGFSRSKSSLTDYGNSLPNGLVFNEYDWNAGCAAYVMIPVWGLLGGFFSTFIFPKRKVLVEREKEKSDFEV